MARVGEHTAYHPDIREHRAGSGYGENLVPSLLSLDHGIGYRLAEIEGVDA
ncbi:MAG TPA: hypothetical protein VFF67_01070 [Thermoplasmata archaeon]|nr:hypothetical protein [Thermoplasmata archaeon]